MNASLAPAGQNPQVYVSEAHHTIEGEQTNDGAAHGGYTMGPPQNRVIQANNSGIGSFSAQNPANMASQRTLSSDVPAPGDMLAQEIKKIRLRISDYYRSSVLEPIFFKLWKLMVHV